MAHSAPRATPVGMLKAEMRRLRTTCRDLRASGVIGSSPRDPTMVESGQVDVIAKESGTRDRRHQNGGPGCLTIC